jgi:hypothetical protein
MPTATFICPICRKNQEVAIPVTRATIPICCGVESNRIWPKIHISDDNYYNEFNPGLGVHVKSKQHYQELCKVMGKIPIESQNPTPQAPKQGKLVDENMMKEILATNPDARISGNEAQAIIDGTFSANATRDSADYSL